MHTLHPLARATATLIRTQVTALLRLVHRLCAMTLASFLISSSPFHPSPRPMIRPITPAHDRTWSCGRHDALMAPCAAEDMALAVPTLAVVGEEARRPSQLAAPNHADQASAWQDDARRLVHWQRCRALLPANTHAVAAFKRAFAAVKQEYMAQELFIHARVTPPQIRT